ARLIRSGTLGDQPSLVEAAWQLLALNRSLRTSALTSASLIGRSRSSAFRLSTTRVAMSPRRLVLVLLFGIGTTATPIMGFDGEGGGSDGRAYGQMTVGPSGRANSPHPSSREGHHSTAWWSSSFLLSRLMLPDFHAAAGTCPRVQRNSVPSTQMRCII